MKKGFTIIEVLIVLAIMAILGTFVAVSYSRFNSMQALDKTSALVSSVLNQARTLTLSSKDNTQYGVHLASGEITLFAGDTYSPSAGSNSVFTLNPQVSLIADISGGGSEVVFERLTGKTDQDGTITLSLVSGASSAKTITIFETGIIQQN